MGRARPGAPIVRPHRASVRQAQGIVRKCGNGPARIVVTAGLLVGAGWIWTMEGSFVCVVSEPSDRFLKTIVALDGIADLGLKFSTSLVGFAAALLIGLKSGLSLTAPVRTSLIV